MHVQTFVELDIDLPDAEGAFSSDAFDTDAFDEDAFDFGEAAAELETNTFRFSFADEVVYFDSIPALQSVSVTPGVVDPGVSIGLRASVRISVKDFQYPLAGTSYFSGTFFGKLRSIKPSLQGSAFRLIRGELGQDIGDMVTEHYVVESLSRNSDQVTIVAKDILKLADGDRSQAPALSNGRLLADIDDSVTSLTLQPAGIGDLEYTASGKVAIGGSEIVSFTRSADVMTIVRGQSNTPQEEHDEDDIVQLVLEYESESPADLIYDLLTNYTSVDPDWCPLSEWQDDINEYIGRLYSAEIAEPTAVKKLLNEIIVQVGLVMWWDEVGRKIRVKSLRPVTGTRLIESTEMISQTFRFTEQPNKRRSQAWTYFALRNPLERLDEVQNFTSGLLTVDPSSDAIYGQTAICKTFCRWIGKNNRPAASRLNALLLSRYTNPPRKFSFDLPIVSDEPAKGQGVTLQHPALQQSDGSLCPCPVQVISVEKQQGRYRVDCEEMLFTEIEDDELPSGVRLVIIDSDSYNIDLRELHDSLYTEADEYDEIMCIIESGILVGSTSTGNPAFDVGDWPDSVDITIKVKGRIQGTGGHGALGFGTAAGKVGGVALYSRYPVTVDNQGEISGGGGGGGGSGSTHEQGGDNFGGGGGAGFNPGVGGINADSGTTEAGGSGNPPFSGDGGGKGQPGDAGLSSSGGAAGSAIDGVSFVTFDTTGTINGSQVN